MEGYARRFTGILISLDSFTALGRRMRGSDHPDVVEEGRRLPVGYDQLGVFHPEISDLWRKAKLL